MHSQLQRFAVQTLLAAGLTQAEVAEATAISVRSVRRIGKEAAVDEFDDLVARRQAAREAKDFAEADRLRDELHARGIEVEDTAAGPVWHRV